MTQETSIPRSPANSRPKETRRSEKIGGFVLSEIVYPPSFRIGWHSHDLAAFALTVSGSTSEVFTGARVDRTDGGVVVRPAGERHWDSIGNRGAKCFLIEFAAEWIESIPKFGPALQRSAFSASMAIRSLLHRAYGERLEGDTASEVAVQALAMEAAVLLTRHAERSRGAYPPRWLRHVKERIDDAFADTPSLTVLARDAGVHPASLARRFRRHFGESIGEYLRMRRLEAAGQLLAKTDLPLSQIALAAGFANHPHFSMAFRTFSGSSPSEFRRLRR